MTFALAWVQFHQPSEVRVYGSFGKFDRSITLPEGNYRHSPCADRRRMRAAIGFSDRRLQERRAQV